MIERGDIILVNVITVYFEISVSSIHLQNFAVLMKVYIVHTTVYNNIDINNNYAQTAQHTTRV